MKYLLVLLLLLAGCTPTVAQSTSPSGSPSAVSSAAPPSPSPTCSPMGGTPRACSQQEYERTQEQNRMTEEAIALYRRWIKESTRLYRAGGTSKATPEMKATTAGDFQGSVLGIFQDLRAAGSRAVSGEVKIVTLGPDPRTDITSDAAAIRACLDSRSLKFVRDGKVIRRGVTFVEYVVAKPVEGQLRLWSVSSGQVSSCSPE